VIVARGRDESVFDPSLPANATIAMTHRFGRVLSGWPLTTVVAARNVVMDFIPVINWFGVVNSAAYALGPPQYLILSDRATGRHIARLGLGRDDLDAHGRLVSIEYDLDMLSREQFLMKHVRHRH
jgi:hypothetical protein